MSGTTGRFASTAGLVTNRPRVALGVLAAITLVLLYGSTLLGPQAGNEAFLPGDSDVARAAETLADSLPDSAGLTSITVLHRGEFLTPEGLTQIDRVIAGGHRL